MVLKVPSDKPTRIITNGCITRVTDDEDKITSTRHVSDVNVGAVRIFAASSVALITDKLILLKQSFSILIVIFLTLKMAFGEVRALCARDCILKAFGISISHEISIKEGMP